MLFTFTHVSLPAGRFYANLGIARIVTQQALLLNVVSIFIGTTVGFIALIYLPAIQSVNAEIKQNVRGCDGGIVCVSCSTPPPPFPASSA